MNKLLISIEIKNIKYPKLLRFRKSQAVFCLTQYFIWNGTRWPNFNGVKKQMISFYKFLFKNQNLNDKIVSKINLTKQILHLSYELWLYSFRRSCLTYLRNESKLFIRKRSEKHCRYRHFVVWNSLSEIIQYVHLNFKFFFYLCLKLYSV